MSQLAPIPQDASVIITRPKAQNKRLIQALKAQGKQVYALPLVDIQPLDEPLIKPCLLDLDQYQFVFPVSVNAINIAFDWIQQFWVQLPVGIYWLAVGQASYQALIAQGVNPQDILTPTCSATSEGLLALPQLHTSEHANKVLILRGNGGRNLFAKTLSLRGFKTQICTLYQRTPIIHEQHTWQAHLQTPTVIQINSSQTLDIALQQYPQLGQQALGVIVPSVRIGKQAQAHFKQVWISHSAYDEDILGLF